MIQCNLALTLLLHRSPQIFPSFAFQLMEVESTILNLPQLLIGFQLGQSPQRMSHTIFIFTKPLGESSRPVDGGTVILEDATSIIRNVLSL